MSSSTVHAKVRSPPPPPPREEREPASPEGFVERTALFTAAFAPDKAARLLEQLVPAARDAAVSLARQVTALEPAARHGRVARTFGERPDAGERLRLVMAQVGPRLARALRERMPPHHRGLFPEKEQPSPPSPEPSTAEALFAARLVKEATR